MRYGQAGISLTKRYESCKLRAYRDPRGILTIGWGHTGPDVYEGQEITQAQADALLLHDMQAAVDAVGRMVRVSVTQNQFDALVDFTFNAGQGSLLHSDLLAHVNAGRFDQAAEDFAAWSHAHIDGKVVVLPGLLRRRVDEAALFRKAA